MHGFSDARPADLRQLKLKPAVPADLSGQVSRALREDIGPGDVTAALIPATTQMRTRLICREPAVLCGRPWADETFRQLDGAVQLRWHADDGARIDAGEVLCEITGPARAILSGERTALNFLQLLSGTATTTAAYVRAVAGTNCRILDTRKTIPGLREAQKYAVLCGGGQNHRTGLHDMVLVKENHIAAAGSIAAAVTAARRQSPQLRVEVETENLEELQQALAAGADIVMLDEFSLDDIRRAVTINRAAARPALLEVSGSVTLETIGAFAATGVDFISIGGLTKHVRAIDLSLRFD